MVIEATYGWYWVVDWLAGPRRATCIWRTRRRLNWGKRRVKNDERDAIDLVDMLRLGRLPEAWIAPPATREVRELVRYRAKLVALRSGLKAQVHAVMAKEGVLPYVDRHVRPTPATHQLDSMALGSHAYTIRVESLRDLIERLRPRDRDARTRDPRTSSTPIGAIGRSRRIHGIGPTIAAILVAEIGDVTRSVPRPRCAPGPASPPSHHESDTTVHRGAMTKQGSRLVRWAVDRRHRPLPRRNPTRRRLPPDRRTARQEPRRGRDRPQNPHARLLRPTRRRDPLPRPKTA